MKLTKKIEAEIWQVYNTWLESYLNGDVKTYGSYFDKEYHFVGSTNNEEFLNRKNTIEFFASTADQFAGKCDLRNESKTIEQCGDHIFITHVFDAWFLNGKDYSFYERFRFSSVMQHTKQGWRFIYQHFSTPDSKTEEGDTIGFNKVHEENQELREAIQRRTLELEKKNRELHIETALAQIRAQAVAMKEPSDLLDIVVTMRNEFIKLGHEAHYFWHMMWLPDTYEKAMTSGDGSKIGFVMKLPRNIHGEIPLIAKWEKSKKPTLVHAMNVKEAIDYVGQMVSLGDFQNIDPQAPSNDDIRHIGGLTFIMARTSHGEIGYSLPGVVKNPPKEDLEILVKFAGAFDLAHRRFLDLKKAEAQAREVQIELALEKVRSRTMAMQKSDELLAAGELLFNEITKLGIESITSGYVLMSADEKIGWNYMPNPSTGKILPEAIGVYHDKTDIMRSVTKSWKKQQPLFVVEMNEAQTIIHQTFIAEQSINFHISAAQLIEVSPPRLKLHNFNFKHGYLLIVGGTRLTSEQEEIMLRFTIVFQQTYTRFLDLQKAEAQAREAQIEVALERVRSRSIGMQKSHELAHVVLLLDEELIGLDIEVNGTQILTNFDNPEKNVTVWFGRQGQDYLENFHVPYMNHPMRKRIHSAWIKGVDFYTERYSKADKNKFFRLLFENSEFRRTTAKRKKFVYDSPGLTRATLLFQNSILIFQRYRLLEFSKEEVAIFKRFGKVFEQAFTRFLDLQKAEAQTREVQIENALEKVRSRSLAMHKPDELQQVVAVVAEKLQELGVILDAGGAIICTYFPDNKDVMHWISAPDFSHSGSYLVPYFDDKTFNEAWDSKNNGESYFSKAYPQEDKNKFFEFAFEHSDYRNFPDDFKQLILQSTEFALSFAWQKNSAILIPSHSGIVPSESDAEIIKRFAKVFEQAYIRFMDLQKAETQAQEAKIEASLEKVRTEALTLKKSDDMLDIARVLYEQLLVLGFSDMRNAIIDIHNDDETFLDYDYSHDMSSAVTLFSFYGDPVIEQQIKKVESSNDAFFEIDIRGKELERLIKTRIQNGEKDDPRLHKIDHLTYNLYSFGNGAIGISNFGTLGDHQKKTLKRFRNVFTFAYKRYTDLAKAEAQALEAKIEAALEKVRSVALGLKNSEDMLEVAKALYEQLLTLGFTNIRNSIIDIDNEDGITFLDYDYSHEMGGSVTLMSYKDDPTLKTQLEDIIATTDGFSEMILEGKQLQDLIAMRRKNGEADDPRLINTDSLSYILYAFGKGAIGISNFGMLNENQKTILSRFRKVFTFAYQRYTDLAQSETQGAALLAEKQRLEKTLSDLQATQQQLIQSEKMASLGELTAGIAHEIQNPLNFVNNFSEVSKELLEEMLEEMEKGDMEEVKSIMNDIVQNLEKINHHGTRADAIVKGMLQHSRKSSAVKEPTDINKLADEYLRLAYHGLRAKDKSFNATLDTDYDETIGRINVIPQDMGRVILNLITNAFYAVTDRKLAVEKDLPGFKNLTGLDAYQPTVTVSTRKLKNQIIITVKDNGNGIPKQVLDKIFQPFFTTKPAGKGTGLGLSLSYDIVKAHGGEMNVETVEQEGSEFKLIFPATN